MRVDPYRRQLREEAAEPSSSRSIHVFLGTKAQYIKTAPLLRLLDDRDIPYRLIDSGQHAAFSTGLRVELDIRAPDCVLAEGEDVTTIPHAIVWSLRLATRLVNGGALRRVVFGGQGGICVVHGDTPSTFLAALMAKRAGLRVAHLEAGLRSRRLFHPFPEELIRIAVMRLSDILFAPDQTAVENLRSMGVKGRIVHLPGNTVAEAIDFHSSHSTSGVQRQNGEGEGPVIVTMHRVENLKRLSRTRQLVDVVEEISTQRSVRFVVHGPTEHVLRKHGLDARLAAAGVELTSLVPHRDFVKMLQEAPFVITDGGSIQEECAILGVPTLLWRGATERPDGVGLNVVISNYEHKKINAFLNNPRQVRSARSPTSRPSEVVLDELLRYSSTELAGPTDRRVTDHKR
jgi:UDP-N-acetylglucosamine 2-epimerase (non-hydrolysing)